jgi:hypothetical protein
MIVFLASTSAALIVNAVIALFIYKAFARASARASEQMDAFRRSGAREWIRSLEEVSTRAAEVTTEAKTEVLSFDATLARTEERLKFALAKADRSCDRACEGVTKTLSRAGKVLSVGQSILDRLFSGARAASAFVRAARSR